jgi:hypothetical protein
MMTASRPRELAEAGRVADASPLYIFDIMKPDNIIISLLIMYLNFVDSRSHHRRATVGPLAGAIG